MAEKDRAAYDPRTQQPQTLGELERRFHVSEVNRHNPTAPAPTPLTPETRIAIDPLDAYARATYREQLGTGPIASMTARYAIDQRVLLAEAEATTFQEAVDALSPQPKRGRQTEKPQEPRPERAIRDKATEARDKWIYDQCCKGVAYDSIARNLSKKNPKWARIGTKQGILACAKRYAKRKRLPEPPPRQER